MNYREKCIREKGEQCVACASTSNIVVHHKDADRENNDLENLVPLCKSCHRALHNGGKTLVDLIESGGVFTGDMQRITVRVESDLNEELGRLSEERRVSQAELGGHLIKEGLSATGTDPGVGVPCADDQQSERVQELERRLREKDEVIAELAKKV